MKAVCPVCGGNSIYNTIWDGAAKMTCRDCRYEENPFDFGEENEP